jgi:signal transduction histidine kinase/Flp pilus assembly protein TadD
MLTKLRFLGITFLICLNTLSQTREQEIKQLLDTYDSLIVDNPIQLSNNLHAARKKSWKTTNDSIIGEVNLVLASFYRRTGEIDEAIEILNSLDALDLTFSQGAKKLTRLGTLHYEKGSFQKAIDTYLKVLKAYEKQDDSIQIAGTFNNIGLVYDDMGDYNESLKHYRKAQQIFIQYSDSAKLAISYNNIGSSYYMQEKYDSALIAFQTSFQIRKKQNQPSKVVSSANNLGLVYNILKQKDSAEYYMNYGIKIALKYNLQRNLSHAYAGYGNFYLDQKDYKNALIYFHRSLEISEKTNHNKLSEANHSELSLIYETIGDSKKALEHYKMMHAIEKELNIISSKEEILKLQTKIALKEQKETFDNQVEDSQKEFDAELSSTNDDKNLLLVFSLVAISLMALFLIMLILNLKKKKIIQNEAIAFSIQNENLNRLIVTKDTFISILAHDLKSPLIAQSSFNNLLISNENNDVLSNQEIKNFALESQLNVNHVLELMDNLLKWAQGSTTDLALEFNMTKISQIIQNAVKIHSDAIYKKNIQIRLFTNDPKVRVDMNSMETVFRNLLSNAVRFTPINGTISFEYNHTEKEHIYYIRDSGEGIPDKISKKLFSKELQDFSSVNSTGLGLLICKNFIHKNNGSIKHIPTANGTCFRISIPK